MFGNMKLIRVNSRHRAKKVRNGYNELPHINRADMVTTDYKSTKIPPKKPASPTACLPKRLLTCFAILAVLITLIVLSLIFLIEKRYEDDVSPSDEHPTTKHNITGHQFYTIEEWGGNVLSYNYPVTKPILYVVICHTAGIFCNNFSECSAQARIVQDLHVNQGHVDIGYNFLIGGDGDIYGGRGWSTQNILRDRTITVSFIGNFVYNELNVSMIDALLALLNNGVAIGELAADYEIVAHNQTSATLSPGRNIYKVIKEFSNFYPDIVPQVKN